MLCRVCEPHSGERCSGKGARRERSSWTAQSILRTNAWSSYLRVSAARSEGRAIAFHELLAYRWQFRPYCEGEHRIRGHWSDNAPCAGTRPPSFDCTTFLRLSKASSRRFRFELLAITPGCFIFLVQIAALIMLELRRPVGDGRTKLVI